jgi:hypothetical protein
MPKKITLQTIKLDSEMATICDLTKLFSKTQMSIDMKKVSAITKNFPDIYASVLKDLPDKYLSPLILGRLSANVHWISNRGWHWTFETIYEDYTLNDDIDMTAKVRLALASRLDAVMKRAIALCEIEYDAEFYDPEDVSVGTL